MENGADKEIEDTNGKTALQWVKREGKTQTENLLTGNLDEVIIVESIRQTQFYQTIENGQFEDAKELWTKGTDVNALDAKGWTALMVASYDGHFAVADFWLKMGPM